MEYTGSPSGRANLPEVKKGNGFTIFVAVVTAIVIFVGGMFAYSMYQDSQSKAHFKEVALVDAAEAAKKDENAMIIIGSKTCSHCQTYKPVAQEYAKDKNTKFYYVDLAEGTNSADLEKHEELATKGTPTTHFFHSGKKVSEVEGQQSIQGIQKAIDAAKGNGFELPKI
ncbi:MAG: thioredoxin family protein [Culicoidibacterales bacterium]